MLRMRLLLIALVALSTAALADPVDDQTVKIKNRDPEMAAAIERAQATLDDFLKLRANPPDGATGFKLKVRFSDPNGSEFMWVMPFEQTQTGFSGILADEPERVTSIRNGQTLTFARSDIADWGYVQDGKQKGSFTVCVLFKHMPEEEVQKYRRDYGFEC